MKILVIEDEKGLNDALCQSLKNQSYTTFPVYDGEAGLNELLSGLYDAVVLDIMLPKLDGISLLRQARANGVQTPVLILTAYSDLENRINGLDSGANYYLTKPFEVEELLACIRTITRTKGVESDGSMPFGDIVLQPKRSGIYCGTTGKFINASAKEMYLLELLIKNKNSYSDKEFLVEKIWGLESDAEYNNIEVYISFLRKKLASLGCHVKIKSQRGVGYILEEENENETA